MTATTARVQLCVLDDLPEGLGRGFTIGSTSLAVFRTRKGEVLAVAGACPHRGAPLADGMLAGDQVVCPYHGFRFHGVTGECDQAGTCAIQTYPVQVENGAVFVTV